MSEPFLTVMSHSAGEQSHALLEMVLRGHLPRPERLLVLNADPDTIYLENETIEVPR